VVALTVLLGFLPVGQGSPQPCDLFESVQEVVLPVAIVTPGGHVTRIIYLDDRPTGGIVPGTPAPANGFVRGDGTWLYFETNSEADLQRGGDGPVRVGSILNNAEDCLQPSANPDELLVGLYCPGDFDTCLGLSP